ncbi:imm11 family protein [Archangium lansingense]|uniref:imm11 family protein n=1 Tax=Archangium lansingense TaxID=2995310 RepID=UPI003B76A169
MKSPLDEQGEDILPWQLFQAKIFEWKKPLVLPLYRPGRSLDFSQTGFNFVVVSGRFVSLCERLGIQDEVQFIPARVEEHPEPYFVLNTLRIIRCVDEARCEEFSFWGPEDGEPERVGHYRHVSGLKVDPEKIGATSIFRPWGWLVPLIVSERVKRAIEEEGLIGPRFIEV